MRSAEEEPLATWLAAAALDLGSQDDTEGTLQAAVRHAVAGVGPAEAAGISVVVGGRVETTAQDGPLARACDRLEHELTEGPCFTSLAKARSLHSPDVGDDDRWPRWGPRARAELGIRSVVSTPLPSDASWLGVMTVWSSRPDAFSVADRHEAAALAALASVALVVVRRNDALRGGLDSRSVVGQAMGIVMERYDIDAAAAFALLTRLSNTHEVKVRVIAEQIVATRELPE